MKLLDKFENLVSVEIQITNSNNPDLNVQTDCRASDSTANFGAISITTGLSRFNLIFNLTGALAPSEFWKYDERLPHSAKITAQKSQKTSESTKWRLGVKSDITAGNMSAGADNTSGEVTTISTKFTLSPDTIHARGTQERPSWSFSARHGEDIIRGTLLKGDHLFKLRTLSENISVRTEIEIPEDAILFVNKNGKYSRYTNNINIIKIIIKKLMRGKHTISIKER